MIWSRNSKSGYNNFEMNAKIILFVTLTRNIKNKSFGFCSILKNWINSSDETYLEYSHKKSMKTVENQYIYK